MNRPISVEKRGAAECHRAGVAKNLPLPLCCLYRERRTSAIHQLALDEAAIDKIKGQRLESNDPGHPIPLCQRGSDVAPPVQRRKARITSSREMIPASR
jgi:hypothetical protein